jgi:flagellar biosynthesis protein FliR
MTMGLGFASAIDPQNGIQVPMVSQFYMILATLIFLSLNGHLLLIDTIYESFRLIPVGAAWPAELPWKIVLWGSNMFANALLIALPALAALLLINLAFGVMTRAAPQLNIFAVGFPITLMAGFLLIFFTLPTYVVQVGNIFSGAFILAKAMLGF